MGPIERDENVAKLLAHFGLEPDDMHRMMALVQQGGLMTEAGNPHSVRAACADFHRSTWFVSAYADGGRLAVTRAGSRPGESWADAIFAYVYARALGTLVERADGESILTFMEYGPEDGVFPRTSPTKAPIARDGTWADDSVLPVEDRCPLRLVEKTKRLCSLAICTLEEFGLSPNLKAGKTSVMLHLAGKGATKARQQASKNGRPVLYLEDLHLEIPIVPQYVHLGGIVDAKLTGKAEARKRLALLGSAFDQGRRLLFQNTSIPLEIRTKLFEVSVRSTLFNLANWIPEGDAWCSLCGGYARCLRRLLMPFAKGVVLFKLPLPAVHILTNSWSMELLACRSRLGLLSALVRNGPEVLWAVLQREHHWLQWIQKDMQMMVDFDPTWPPVELGSWQTWKQRILAGPGAFKATVRRMLHKLHAKESEQHRTTVALWVMYRQTSWCRRTEQVAGDLWTCRMCCRSFRSKGGLGAHMFKTHGRKAAYRACVQGSLCQACGVQFWTEARLSVHLRDTPRCSNMLRSQGLVTSVVRPGHGSKEWRRLEVEQYTPAPTAHQAEPLDGHAGPRWCDEATDAYRTICTKLFDKPAWPTVAEATSVISNVLEQFPLFVMEEHDICDLISREMHELQEAEMLPWEGGSMENVDTALRAALQRSECKPASDEDAGLTLLEFMDEVVNIDWKAAVSDVCVTPNLTSEQLDIGWEAEKPVFREIKDVSAAINDPLMFVPSELRTAWGRVLQGTVSTVRAPPSFWAHPFSAPFRPLRACK